MMDAGPAAPAVTAGPGAEYRAAPFLPRLGAFLIDVAVGAIPTIVAVLGVFVVSPVVWVPVSETLYYKVTPLWTIVYMLAKDGWFAGGSFGKRMMKLMVVHLPDNRPCTPGRALIRNAVYLAACLVPFVGGLIEPVALLIDDKGRRLGDKAAKTQVIAAAAYRAPQ